MFVILLAMYYTKDKSCLVIHTDSQAAMATIARGICRNQKVNSIVDKFWHLSRKKQVTPVLYYISTNDNPADEPSRRKPRCKVVPVKRLKRCFKTVNPLLRREVSEFMMKKYNFF